LIERELGLLNLQDSAISSFAGGSAKAIGGK
jgi:hypothetical protein